MTVRFVTKPQDEFDAQLQRSRGAPRASTRKAGILHGTFCLAGGVARLDAFRKVRERHRTLSVKTHHPRALLGSTADAALAINWSGVLVYAIAVSSSIYINVAPSLLIDCVIMLLRSRRRSHSSRGSPGLLRFGKSLQNGATRGSKHEAY